MRDTPEGLSERIVSREDMATFLDELGRDADEHGSQWENLHISDMLESMAAWLRDTTDSECHPQPGLSPEQWRFVADLILAGKHYE